MNCVEYAVKEFVKCDIVATERGLHFQEILPYILLIPIYKYPALQYYDKDEMVLVWSDEEAEEKFNNLLNTFDAIVLGIVNDRPHAIVWKNKVAYDEFHHYGDIPKTMNVVEAWLIPKGVVNENLLQKT